MDRVDWESQGGTKGADHTQEAEQPGLVTTRCRAEGQPLGTWESECWYHSLTQGTGGAAAGWLMGRHVPLQACRKENPEGLSSQRQLQFGSREESPRSTSTERAEVRLTENQGEHDRLRTGHVRVTSKRARSGSQREQEKQELAAVRALQGPKQHHLRTGKGSGGTRPPTLPASPQPRELRFFCVLAALMHTEWPSGSLPPLPVPPQTPLKWGS